MFFNQSTVLKAVFNNSGAIESSQHNVNKFLDFEGIDEALELANNPSDTRSSRDKKGNPPGNGFHTSVRRELPKLQLTCFSNKISEASNMITHVRSPGLSNNYEDEGSTESIVELRAKRNDDKNDCSNHLYLGDSSPPNITSSFSETPVIDDRKMMDAAATKKDLTQMRNDSSILHGDVIDNITEVYRKQQRDFKAIENHFALIQATLLRIESKCDQLAIQEESEQSQSTVVVADFNEPGTADSVQDSLDGSDAGTVLAIPQRLDSFYLIGNNCVEDHFK